MTMALLRHVKDGKETYDALMVVCPGCIEWGGTGLHMLPVSGDATKRPMWTWNGSLSSPTLSPSIMTHNGDDGICHSYLEEGVWRYLDDTTHSLAGQLIPAPDLPDFVLDD
jgi:hypothetical protein